MLADVMTRQVTEKKRTQDFLKYALSKRDPIPARKNHDRNKSVLGNAGQSMMSKRTSQYGEVPSPGRGHMASLSLDSSAIKGGIRARTRSVLTTHDTQLSQSQR